MTVAIPAYDEVDCLEQAVVAARAAVARAVGTAAGEILVVDDGSRDGTAALADRLAVQHSNVRVVRHAANRGFSGAIGTCLREAAADWIFLAPADGQISMDVLDAFLERSVDADIVVGIRDHRVEGMGRTILSRGFHVLSRVLFRLPQQEFSSAFLFRRALTDAMAFASLDRAATLLPELLFRARCRGARIATIEVHHLPRVAGRPKGGQLLVAAVTSVELVRIAVVARIGEWTASRSVERPLSS